METTEVLYLPLENLRQCRYLIDNKYPHKIIKVHSQNYIIFKLPTNDHIGLAWPTVTGKIDGASDEIDAILTYNKEINDAAIKILKTKLVLTPRYSR